MRTRKQGLAGPNRPNALDELRQSASQSAGLFEDRIMLSICLVGQECGITLHPPRRSSREH